MIDEPTGNTCQKVSKSDQKKMTWMKIVVDSWALTAHLDDMDYSGEQLNSTNQRYLRFV